MLAIQFGPEQASCRGVLLGVEDGDVDGDVDPNKETAGDGSDEKVQDWRVFIAGDGRGMLKSGLWIVKGGVTMLRPLAAADELFKSLLISMICDSRKPYG